MAVKNNLTIFQRLGQVINPENVRPTQTQPKANTQRYNIGSDVLLKTDNKADFDRIKLQQQQNKYLANQWSRVDSGLFQQSINYETTRIASYSDFENMEFYPAIAAALDVMMEESTTVNDKGKIMNIYSDSKRVKGILEDLFYNRLDIHTSLPMWTRNTVKYGDNFVFLNIDDTHGVVGAKQMPNYEMDRWENDLFSMINGNTHENETSKTDKTKFIWRGRNIEFNSWQMAHFRLLGEDKRLPYGTSVLEKARRIWKQLIMSEDAMLVYRVTRAPERRIYKVFVGNIDDADVPAYVNSIADRFKRAQVMDSQTGQMDLRYNQMPIWKESPIPLLDGRTLSIEELAKEYNEGKENWVYSIQDDTHQVVAGKVTWCGLNYTADEMVKVWLDDDTYIVTAKEHPFILRDGSKKRADELKINDSLMPFYHKLSTKEDGMRIEGYPMVYNPRTGKYKFTHRVVGEDCLQVEKGIVSKNTDWSINNNLTIHHKDFTKTNSNPSNLEWIGNVDHINYHRKRGGEILTRYNKSEKKRLRNIELAKQQNWGARFIPYNNSELHSEHNEIRKQAQLKDWSNPEKKELRSKGMKIKFDSFIWGSIRTNIVNNKIVNRKTLIEFLNTDNIVNHTISINKNDRLKNQRRIERTVVERLLKDKGFNTITEYITENKKNHKVKSLEIIGGDDVYCMTVIGPNGEDDRHNFATLSFKNNGEVSLSGSFLGNSNDQDYFIPVRSEDAPSPIDTLPGASNLDQIADIEYLRNNLFTALRVPKPFLGFDETTGDGKNLALQDIRFSRTINRIQQSMIQELNKIAIIHLYLLGFEEDFDNFTITLNNPSTQADMLRVEQTQNKVTLYKDAVSEAGNGFAAMSMTRAKREILGMSDDEIKSDLLEQRMEKAAAAELANSANVIKHTGTFDVVDRVYGDMALALQGGGNGGGEGEEGGATSGGGGGGGLGGSFGGGGTGGEDLDFGDEEPAVDVETPEGGEEIDAAAGGEDLNFGDEETPEQVAESVRRIKRILGEQKILLSNKLNKRTERYRGRFVDTLIESIKPKTTYTDEKVKVYDKNVKVNQEIDTMINGIDKMLGE